MSGAAASLFHPSALDTLRPPSSDNPRVGLAASLMAHVLLVAALALGVHWRSEETSLPVAAELWAATPQMAPAPQPVTEPPPPPPPQPVARTQPTPPPPAATAQRDAEIATEKAKASKARHDAELREAKAEQERLAKLKAEQDEKKAKRDKEKADQAKRDKAEAERKQAEEAKAEKAAEAQREKLRQQQLQRLNAQLGGNGSGGGSAAQEAGPSAGYAGRIKARVLPNIVLTEDVQGNPTAEVEVTVAPDGSIIGRRITKKSGSAVWDDAVLRALDKTAILPRDTDGRVPTRMVLAFRPKD